MQRESTKLKNTDLASYRIEIGRRCYRRAQRQPGQLSRVNRLAPYYADRPQHNSTIYTTRDGKGYETRRSAVSL